MKTLKYYTYHQNNSGGRYDVGPVMAPIMIVQAHDCEEANHLAQRIGLYWDGVAMGMDCECGEHDATPEPTIYGSTDLEKWSVRRHDREPQVYVRVFDWSGDIHEF